VHNKTLIYPTNGKYTSRDLQLEDGKGIISHVNEYIYLGVRITKHGNHEPEINDRINPLAPELFI